MNPSKSPKPVTPEECRACPGSKRRWALWILGCFAAFVLLLVASVAFTVWWIQRPITPVVLTSAEKGVLEEKLRAFGASAQPAMVKSTDSTAQTQMPVRQGLEKSPVENARPAERQGEPVYTPGSKTLKLTERELNGLLNSNTELGDTVRIELGTDAINAYLAVPIPKDFPIGGGKTFRMRGRFKVSLAENHTPYAILEDVTVFGLSLPKDWLGGIKGENLLTDAVGERDGKPIIAGVKSLQIKPGVLMLEVAD